MDRTTMYAKYFLSALRVLRTAKAVITNSREVHGQQLAKLSEQNALLKTKIIKLQENLRKTQAYYTAARTHFPLYKGGIFTDILTNSGEQLRASMYVSLLPSALPVAFELSRQFGGLVVCDNVENIDVDKHSAAPKWPPYVVRMVNQLARGAIYDCDKILTVGSALGLTLAPFGKPTLVLPNFRNFEIPEPGSFISNNFGLGPEHTVLFASGNVVVGFEPVVDAMSLLPESVHLVALVQLKPIEYERKILALVRERGLTKRIHFAPFVPYNQLASTAAAADVGLITSDITNPNGAVGLPNRLFDYLTAGLPVVSPAMPDVKTLIEEHGFGQTIAATSATEWANGISHVIAHLPEFKERALKARRTLTWESQEAALFDFLERPTSVTFIGFRDLTRYQRHLRMGRTLNALGCSVKYAFFSRDPLRENLPLELDFYWTDDMYMRSRGLVRLEKGIGLNASSETL